MATDPVEAELRRRATRAGVRREDLPDDPDDALDALGVVMPSRANRRPRPSRDPATTTPPRKPPSRPPSPPGGRTPSHAARKPRGARPAPARQTTSTKTPKAKTVKASGRPRRRRQGGLPVRTARAAGRHVARGARQGLAPARAAAVNTGHLAIGLLGLVALYLALTSSDAIALLVRAPAAAVRWLADPQATVLGG